MRIPESRMTVCTSGILPGPSVDFAKETVRPKLALSLNASNDTRPRIHHAHHPQMEHRRAPRSSAHHPPRATASGSPSSTSSSAASTTRSQHADELIALVNGMKRSRSISSSGTRPRHAYHEPTRRRRRCLPELLIAGGIPTYIRRPRGRDIYAACGQLKRTVETTPAPLIEITSAEAHAG